MKNLLPILLTGVLLSLGVAVNTETASNGPVYEITDLTVPLAKDLTADVGMALSAMTMLTELQAQGYRLIPW